MSILHRRKRVSSMRNPVVLLSTILLISISINASYIRTASARASLANDETYEDVLDKNGEKLLYGAYNTFTVWKVEGSVAYRHFYFGLGYPGVKVRTDTELTMGFRGDNYRIFACQANGSIATVPPPSEGAPQESLIKVRYNTTDGFYRLQITQETPPVYMQLVTLSQGGLHCTRGTDGTRLQFELTTLDKLVVDNDIGDAHAHNGVIT